MIITIIVIVSYYKTLASMNNLSNS